MCRTSFGASLSHRQTSGWQSVWGCEGRVLDLSIFKHWRHFCSADPGRVHYTGTEITPRFDL